MIEQVLIGGLLGDGCIRVHEGVARYCEGKSLAQKPYLEWKAQVFSSLHGKVYEVNGKYHYAYLQTNLRSSVIENLYDKWYKNGKKLLNVSDLFNVDELGLAVWYMDDGTYSYSSYPRGCVKITASFEESDAIKNFFRQKFDLNPKIRNRPDPPCVYDIVFSSKESEELLSKIKNFVHPCLFYKLGNLHPSNKIRFNQVRERYLKYCKTEKYKKQHNAWKREWRRSNK